jgi:putative Mg2+ transporter-C (MgtC) family protein
MPTDLDLVLRLLLAAVLAGAVGVERELTDQPAGFRTHILVGLGACLFAVLSIVAGRVALGPGGDAAGNVDVTRIAAQIVTGIGFIGAGVIFKSGPTIRGLTTAATLWVTAAIGTAAGMGALLMAIATTGLTMLVLIGLRPLRRLVRRRAPEEAEFLVEGDAGLSIESLTGEMGRQHAGVEHISVEADNGTRSVRMVVRLPSSTRPDAIAEALADASAVRRVEWSRR